MALSTYITNDEIAVLIVYLVSLTGGLIWALYRIYVLEKREKLWRELVGITKHYYSADSKEDTEIHVCQNWNYIRKLKQQLGYDKNQTS